MVSFNLALSSGVTALSLARGSSMGKIGVTCRQPFLGATDWIEEDLKKTSKPASNKKESE